MQVVSPAPGGFCCVVRLSVDTSKGTLIKPTILVLCVLAERRGENPVRT